MNTIALNALDSLNNPVDLSFVIVSFNTADLIGTCINSIYSIGDFNKEIFVVDNASNDGSADFIRSEFPAAKVIANENNRGFAAANNQVFPFCRGRYIFLMNPDAEFIPATFQYIISYMDSNPHIGLAGIKLINPDGSAQESFSFEYPGQKYASRELAGLKGSIAWVLGAGMLIRSDLIRELGGFDESFFVYGEDQDLCLRIRRAGYGIGYIDSATMVHLGGQSERQSRGPEVWRKKLLAEYVFYRKHYQPHTINRITRSYLMKSDWRIASLRLFFPFYADKNEAREKLLRYEIISAVIRREILKKNEQNRS